MAPTTHCQHMVATITITLPMINVNNYGQEDSDDDDDDDGPLSPKKLQRELKAFKRQHAGELDDDELKKIDGQEYLARLQRIIISDLSGKTMSTADKNAILDAMIRLSRVLGLSPKCLRIQDVGIKDLDPILLPSVEGGQSAEVEIFKGKIDGPDLIVKALKKRPGPGDKELEAKGIINGLKHLHNEQVIHGDLRRSSLLVPRGEAPRIADSGLAQLLGKAAGKDVKSDRYQCARVLYKEVFEGSMLANKPPTRLPGMSNETWEVIKGWLGTNTHSQPTV
ncbi:hypothetical protein AAF712_016124 [Marasmius tenuissimus]|uniref:Protein kinase domain-containing protein n=1 Tax=Marasmius tenuissimus TaxID=585030 RepID=A0ABR2Z6G9_9AGAR